MTEPVCTCDEGRHGVTRQFGHEPHYAGCPRWGTPKGFTVRPFTPAELRALEGLDDGVLHVESERVDQDDALDVDVVRPSWDDWGLALARAVALRADCTRRRVGAVILDAEHRVVASGYNGAPAGQPGCLSDGACPRGRLSYDQQPGGIGYDLQRGRCDALHAEMNAVIYAGRDRAKGGTLYCTDEPCHMCTLVIAAAGIDRVVVA